jgi:hypothetical protein
VAGLAEAKISLELDDEISLELDVDAAEARGR